jgi:magnesium-transporting ATPase (P-type)
MNKTKIILTLFLTGTIFAAWASFVGALNLSPFNGYTFLGSALAMTWLMFNHDLAEVSNSDKEKFLQFHKRKGWPIVWLGFLIMVFSFFVG